MKELSLIFVLAVTVTLTQGKDYGEICDKDEDCSYTGSSCVIYTDCTKGTCRCDVSDYVAVVDGGKMACKTATWVNNGDTCDPADSTKKCKRNSGCIKCPTGDAQENEKRCRSGGMASITTAKSNKKYTFNKGGEQRSLSLLALVVSLVITKFHY